jgi:hypothetical protein
LGEHQSAEGEHFVAIKHGGFLTFGCRLGSLHHN